MKTSNRLPLPRHQLDALAIETNYFTAGDPGNEPVVLLHGMSTSGDSFRELMHDLADDYYLIAPDLPGFGYTEDTEPYTLPHLVEWLAAFFDALELRPAQLIGHSFGGLLASSYTIAYPEDVKQQVLLAPAILVVEDFPDWMLGLSRFGMSESVIGLGVSASRVMLERQIRLPFHSPEVLDESVWERRRTDYANARASAAVMRAVARHDIRPKLGQLHKPTTLIWGEADPVVPPANATRLVDMLPRAEAHLLSACGHVPQIERTEAVAKIVRSSFGKSAHKAAPVQFWMDGEQRTIRSDQLS